MAKINRLSVCERQRSRRQAASVIQAASVHEVALSMRGWRVSTAAVIRFATPTRRLRSRAPGETAEGGYTSAVNGG